MKVLQTRALVACLLAVVLMCGRPSEAADDDICRLFPNGTVIRDPDSCSRSIKCIDFVSHYDECGGSTPFYDKDEDKCVTSLSDHSTCDISCTNSPGQFVADPKSCVGYYYCATEELALWGSCPDGTHFDGTRQACVYTSESECSVATLDVCAIVKDGVHFKDENNCHKYFMCSKSKITTKTCPKQYYDAASGECVAKSLVDCPEHPLPPNVCGTTKSALKNTFVPDGATCRGYFYCKDVADGPDPSPLWGQCGSDTFFDEKSQSCKDPVDVVCGEDRCDGRSLTFVISEEKGCRHYLRCANGVSQGEFTCGNYFFDEKMGACVSSIIEYTACKG